MTPSTSAARGHASTPSSPRCSSVSSGPTRSAVWYGVVVGAAARGLPCSPRRRLAGGLAQQPGQGDGAPDGRPRLRRARPLHLPPSAGGAHPLPRLRRRRPPRAGVRSRTYYDLCVALDAKPLRGPRNQKPRGAARSYRGGPRRPACSSRTDASISTSPDGRMGGTARGRGLAEAGDAGVPRSSTDRSPANAFLFWDEPEANANPQLSKLTREVVFQLADRGRAKVFLATHDYVLSTSDRLARDRGDARWRPGTAFFALRRRDGERASSSSAGGCSPSSRGQSDPPKHSRRCTSGARGVRGGRSVPVKTVRSR